MKWVFGIGKYVVGFGILAAVIYKYWEPNAEKGSPGLRDLLQGPIAWEWLLGCMLLLFVAYSLTIVRWYLLVRSLNIPFKLRHAFQLGLLGLFGNTFLPGSVGVTFSKRISSPRTVQGGARRPSPRCWPTTTPASWRMRREDSCRDVEGEDDREVCGRGEQHAVPNHAHRLAKLPTREA